VEGFSVSGNDKTGNIIIYKKIYCKIEKRFMDNTAIIAMLHYAKKIYESLA